MTRGGNGSHALTIDEVWDGFNGGNDRLKIERLSVGEFQGAAVSSLLSMYATSKRLLLISSLRYVKVVQSSCYRVGKV